MTVKRSEDDKGLILFLLALSAVFLVAVCALSVANTPSIAPLLSETLPVTTYTVATTTTASHTDQTSILISVNTATKEQLMELPGIGEVLAENIIEFREKNGGIFYLDDLLDVKGIGEKKLEEILPFITL